jgi:methylated-DNA-protein-cysteine methyltransferase-like protein
MTKPVISEGGRGGARQRGRRSPTDAEHIAALYADIYDLVRRIPRGRVATYGQVAELAGRPGAARVVGAAMRLSAGQGVPWQRVIGRQGKRLGKISILDPVGGATQRALLESEGVELTERGSIRLDRYGWLPVDP